MKIGELAQRSNILAVTIRYYESIGLLPAPPRDRSGYRIYRPEHLRRLRFLSRCRNLGFSLEEIQSLIRLVVKRGQSCRSVSLLAERHLSGVRSKIDELRRLESVLSALASSCADGSIASCRILDALHTDPDDHGKHLDASPVAASWNPA